MYMNSIKNLIRNEAENDGHGIRFLIYLSSMGRHETVISAFVSTCFCKNNGAPILRISSNKTEKPYYLHGIKWMIPGRNPYSPSGKDDHQTISKCSQHSWSWHPALI